MESSSQLSEGRDSSFTADPNHPVSSAAVERGANPPRQAWVILAALFYVQVVNFVDKAVIGIAAPSIMKDLSLSAAEYGLVASSFYALYAIGGIVIATMFGHRFAPRTILSWLLIVWTAAQFPVILAASLSALVFSRLVLGAGEGAGTPTAINCCYEWFPAERRSFPTAILFFGNTVGKIIAAPLLTYAILAFGWHYAFLVCALMGGIAAIMWLIVGRSGPWAAPPARKTSTGKSLEILRNKAIWFNPSIIGMCVICFCSYWMTGFSISWLAPYLRLSLGFDATTTGWTISAIYVGQSVLLFALTALSDWMARSGVSGRVARSGLIGVCLVVSAAAFAACALIADPIANVILFMIGTAMPVAVLALAPALVANLLPDAWRNQTVGLIFAGVTISGFFAPVTTGYLVDSQGGAFTAALLVTGGIALIGGIASLFFVDPSQRCVEE